MQKMLKSEKGISPILATLLLIVIAVAAIIVTYAWVMTFMGAQTGTAGTLFRVQNVYWDKSTNQTKIDIQNYGTSNAKIINLWIGTSTSNLPKVTSYTDIDADTGQIIEVDETKTITLNWPNAFAMMWTSGQKYYIKVEAQGAEPVTQGPYTAS